MQCRRRLGPRRKVINSPFNAKFRIGGFLERKHEACCQHGHESEEALKDREERLSEEGLTLCFHFDIQTKGSPEVTNKGESKQKLTSQARA